jgi:hypothetical protein
MQLSRLGAPALAAVLIGCADASAPIGSTYATAATSPLARSATGSIAGFVIDDAENCIVGARIEVVDGTQAGSRFTQTMCGFWDYGEDNGFAFHDLTADVPVTITASADGYTSRTIEAMPANPYSYSIMIVLTKRKLSERDHHVSTLPSFPRRP